MSSYATIIYRKKKSREAVIETLSLLDALEIMSQNNIEVLSVDASCPQATFRSAMSRFNRKYGASITTRFIPTSFS